MTAYYLTHAGVGVTLIESRGIGSQASGNSAGGLNPLHGPEIPGRLADLAMESFDLHLALWDQLSRKDLAAAGVRKVSRLFLQFNSAETASLVKTLDLYRQHKARGFAAELIDAKQTRLLDPRINPEVEGALWTKGNAAVDALEYNRVIAGLIVGKGGKIIDANVIGLASAENRVVGVITNRGQIACGAVVIATGAWAAGPSQWLGIPLPVSPLKGEMLLFNLPGAALNHDLSHGGFSFFARGDARVWLGATETYEGFNDLPTEAAKRRLLDAGARIMPAINEGQIQKQSAGLRPVTPDNLPIIGQTRQYENVYLGMGGGTKGTLVSAGIGKGIANLITQGAASLSIDCARPNRFAPAT